MEQNTSNELLQMTNTLLQEIEELKNKLEYEKQQHKHWETLAITFHDALWELIDTHSPKHSFASVSAKGQA